jgi:carnitine O-acetyltransferase
MNAFDCCVRSKDYIDDSTNPKKSTTSSLPSSPPTFQSVNMTNQNQTQKEKASTFARQCELSRLPIPTLDETLTAFQSTLEPLLTATEYTKAKRDIQTFRTNESQGPKLHSLLLEYEEQNVSSQTVGSYIEEFWSEAYLSPNTSVVLNLNPYFLLENDPNLVKQSQIPRAASLCFNSLKFAHSVKNETLTPETFKSNPICMDQFRSLLGSTRIPKLDEADVVEVDPHSTHVAVLYRHEFYFFTALWPHDHPSHPNAVAVSEAEIAHILKSIVQDGKQQTPLHHDTATTTSSSSSSPSALGVLTTLPRMQWARARENLASSSAHNKTTLEILDSALFCLVLDDYIPSTVHHAAANLLHGTTELKVNAELGVEYQVGTCCNRWYDKLQLIVCGDGSAGVNFEHSAIDGHTALRFASDVFAETLVSFAKSITKSIYPKGECPISNVLESTVVLASFMEEHHGGGLDTNPKKLTWDDVPGIQDQIYHAETKLGDSISADDTHVLEFEDFGKNLIVRNKMR